MALVIRSTAFANGESVPKRYTGDGEDVSPPLTWSDLPVGTKEIALICDDPDAPGGTWIHWVIYNIPVTETGLMENFGRVRVQPNGIVQGLNSWGKSGYGGPCPPNGAHRYFFKLYALNDMLAAKPKAKKQDLLKSMQGHILEEADLMGKYIRK